METNTPVTFTREEVAQILKVTVRTLGNWHQRGYGPPAIKIRGIYRYECTALQEWLSAGAATVADDPA